MIQNNQLLSPELLIDYGFKPEYLPGSWYYLELTPEIDTDFRLWFFMPEFETEGIRLSTDSTTGIELPNVKYLYQVKNIVECLTGIEFKNEKN